MNIYELIHYKENYNKLNNIRNQRENIIPFVGAGVSIECGLYSWIDMLDIIAKDYFTVNEIKQMHNSGDCFAYADRIVEVTGNQHMIMQKIGEVFQNAKISLTDTPYILTSSFSNLIVTTNYDTILEEASRQNINASPLKPLLPCLKGQMDAAIQNNDRCLLKIHGSIEETSSFILTTEQYDKFYGKSSPRNKPLPRYLKKLFTAKKLLFVGCSLESDRTLDILLDCVKKDERISHFAIVPWIENENKRIMRSRRFTQLGIDPIYFPDGEYDSIRKLLRYLAEENLFMKQIENILDEISDKITSNTIVSIVKESFYNTAHFFPKLLDDIFSPSSIEYAHILKEKISSLSESDTYYNVLLSIFDMYIDLGDFDEKDDIKKCYKQQFAEQCLKGKSINDLLKKQWSIKHNLSQNNTNNKWMKHLSSEEINNNAIALINKLQYRNGMSFSDIRPIYTLAIELEDYFGEKINYHNRTRLLNSIGAFSYYYNESEIGKKHLETAIQLVNDNGPKEQSEMLFLAKCHYNLALAYANIGDLKKALESISLDLKLKIDYGENLQLYARSLDLHATILKLLSPYEAINIYLDAARTKEVYTKILRNDKKIQDDIDASWATALFNIGLLCRDVELYDSAYEYVLFANNIRSKILDTCNRDFCSSLNVQAELELVLHKTKDPSQIIFIIDSKENLPEGFDKIMGHTYYVCALYYFIKKDFVTAYDYSQRSLDELTEEKSTDFIQAIKSRLILALSLQHIKRLGIGLQYPSNTESINEIIADIKRFLGNDSFYLSYPYKLLNIYSESKDKKVLYADQYDQIQNKYRQERNKMKKDVDSYYDMIK